MINETRSIYSILSEFCNALNRSKPPILFSNLSGLIFRPRIAFGPDNAIFSMCWCWDRTANRFTCTGIGTTILFAPEPLLPPAPRLIPCDVKPALTRFHFARRFWNQILTWNFPNKKWIYQWISDHFCDDSMNNYLNFAEFQTGGDLATLC